ncbi:MAG: hypothetical protein H6744_05520 [Deltaproteobacteria bacterium]|nr:hypothetical protein [Deltaproteobacteria bacterium]MCB9786138.1 hypothetical protein [Deltaproteobacteria bacterium]
MIPPSTSLLWRRTIALVVIMHAVRLGMAAWQGEHTVLLSVLCCAAVLGSARTMARRAHPLWMAVALVALAGIHELVRAAVGNYEDQIFQTAATGVGWLAGAGVAALALAPSEPTRRREAIESMAATGAAAGLGAAYLCAGLSKLVAAGPATWFDPDWLRIIAMEHRPQGMGAARAWLFEHAVTSPGFGLAGSAYAVMAELAAVFLPLGRRPRRVAGSMLLVLHAGIWLFTDILFIAGFTFLLVFTFDWPGLLRRSASVEPPQPPRPPELRPRRPALVALAALAALATALVWLLPVERRTHAAPQPDAPTQSPAPR